MLTIRRTQQSDLPAAMQIMTDAWTPIFEGFRLQVGDEMYPLLYSGWQQPKAERISRSLMGEHGWVAELDGRIAGFGFWVSDSNPKVGRIGENAVANDMRGRGIGVEIHRRMLEQMKDEGYTYAAVHTGLDDAHAPARRAYEKSGFVHGLPSVDYYMPLRNGISGSDPAIRPATEADVERACDIAVQAWTPIREIFRKNHLGDDIYHLIFDGWQAGKRASVAAAMRSGLGYVTEIDGQVMGFISYRINEKGWGVIGENALDNAMRGRGFGTKQYAYVFDRMQEEKVEYVTVHTGLDDGHAPARRAYERAGFCKRIPTINYYKEI